MTLMLWATLSILMLLLIGGLVRVAWGPTLPDRLSATLLMGTAGTAILLVLSVALAMPALVDAALVLVLLAVVSAVALSRSGTADLNEEGAGHVG